MSKTIGEKLTENRDALSALLAFANQKTGASDVSLGDAVKTLADGYGQGGDGGLKLIADIVSSGGDQFIDVQPIIARVVIAEIEITEVVPTVHGIWVNFNGTAAPTSTASRDMSTGNGSKTTAGLYYGIALIGDGFIVSTGINPDGAVTNATKSTRINLYNTPITKIGVAVQNNGFVLPQGASIKFYAI